MQFIKPCRVWIVKGSRKVSLLLELGLFLILCSVLSPELPQILAVTSARIDAEDGGMWSFCYEFLYVFFFIYVEL